MIRLSVPEIQGGPLSVTEEKKKKEKDWSWSILLVLVGWNADFLLFSQPFSERSSFNESIVINMSLKKKNIQPHFDILKEVVILSP